MKPPFSLKRQSLFYIKYIESRNVPSLKSIYRNYIKSGMSLYKHCNISLGSYFFKLLEYKKQPIVAQYAKLSQANQILKSFDEKKINKNQTIGESTSNESFVESQLSSQQMSSAQQNRIRLHKQRMQRHLTQTLLQTFQSLYHLSNAASDILKPQQQLDLRTAQLAKLIHLAFNTSHFYTSTLFPRKDFHSLLLLDHLEDDMEYEVLSQKDKQFVRDVIVKVCGRKKLNHTKYRTAIEYIKDPNASMNQPKVDRVELMSKAKRKKTYSKQLQQNQQQEQRDNSYKDQDEENFKDQEQKDYEEEEWKLLSEQLRNRAVRRIFDSQNPSKANEKKSSVSRKHLTNTLLLQIILNLKLNQTLSNPKPQLEYELYKICKRLFKLTNENDSKEEVETFTSQKSSENTLSKAQIEEIQKLPLLEDAILKYDFIDEFVNRKRIIIV